MSTTLFAFVTFGNCEFSQLCVKSVRETTKTPIDIFTIVGKPNDFKTLDWLKTEPEIKFKVHDQNYGFPYCLNDIFDYAWKENNYDYLIIAGNDIVAYPNAIESLIELADETEYECINALQYDVRNLVEDYPEVSRYFHGSKKLFYDFNESPWMQFREYDKPQEILDMQLLDIQNLCLYKKSSFDKIGYTDVNFYPAYFVDNDYARRMAEYPIKSCTLANARFFHFWSRVINQGTDGSTSRYFENNRDYYKSKWGGNFAEETIKAPLLIDTRDDEISKIEYWRNKRR
jgi:GT2 family glycosyltransferase